MALIVPKKQWNSIKDAVKSVLRILSAHNQAFVFGTRTMEF